MDGTERGRWRMPAEWEQHERCLIAWPTRAELWTHHLEQARREYAATADAISAFEPVTMVADPERSRRPADPARVSGCPRSRSA